ncbi:MAG TPA: RNA methyltransferase [Casimicrobiaceae bacterium]|nr:RNA methyltransferase [Casimicrobiaceae bacterium]
MRRITSRHNERLRDVARLIASSRERRKSGRCVLEGAHLIDVYIARIGTPQMMVVAEDALVRADVAALVGQVPPGRTIIVSRKLFDQVASLPADIGVLAVIPTPRMEPRKEADLCLLLDDVQDPGNVGSMIRTAAAAGVAQVILSPRCAFAWAPKVLRAAQGAHFLTSIVEDADLVAWAGAFKAMRGRVFATVVAGATPLYEADLCGRIAIAIGSEGRGVSDALLAAADRRIVIPMASGSESLNAAAAAAVTLFEAVRQRAMRASRPDERA